MGPGDPMPSETSRRLSGLSLKLITLALSCSAVRADPVEDFYRDKQVTIIVGVSVGGGYDLYARLLSRHLGRHIPGKPTIVVQNMPGAGSLKAALYVNAVAPRNGASIVTFSRGIPLAPLLSGADFNGAELGYVGSMATDTSVCITWKTARAKNWDDFLTKDFVLGGQGKDADPDLFAALLRNEFGSRHRLVTGYPGNADIMLAMERGEVDGLCGLSYSTIVSAHPDWLKNKSINIVVQAGLYRNPALKDVPSLMDLTTRETQRQVVKLAVAPQAMARPFAVGPDVPADRLAALRKAFDITMRDAEFLADAAKLNLDVDPMSGADINKLVSELYETPRDILQEAVRAMSN